MNVKPCTRTKKKLLTNGNGNPFPQAAPRILRFQLSKSNVSLSDLTVTRVFQTLPSKVYDSVFTLYSGKTNFGHTIIFLTQL